MKAYKVDFTYDNDIDMLDTVLSLYALTVLKKPLAYRESIVLREYMLNGYNPGTKKAICLNLGIKPSNIDSLNYSLKKKGFLVPHPTNQRLKLLNKELTDVKNCFMDRGEKRVFMVNFENR